MTAEEERELMTGEMEIRVTYDNEFLGKGTLFEGKYSGQELRNAVATLLARQVLHDGMPHASGMWFAERLRGPTPAVYHRWLRSQQQPQTPAREGGE